MDKSSNFCHFSEVVNTKSRTRAVRPSAVVREMLPHAEEAAGLLRALANEQRLMILCNLTGGELSVGEINSRLRLSQSALSQHLAVLRDYDIVSTRRESQTVYYALVPGPAAKVIEMLYRLYCG
jgi:DNA-binding transcriptional ArsR family regulator